MIETDATFVLNVKFHWMRVIKGESRGGQGLTTSASASDDITKLSFFCDSIKNI